ncbi:Uncharacterised protein [Mycobacterium tuberculosis]|nr:Uncharacterised protein [Mycobacterium tuberculosis]
MKNPTNSRREKRSFRQFLISETQSSIVLIGDKIMVSRKRWMVRNVDLIIERVCDGERVLVESNF